MLVVGSGPAGLAAAIAAARSGVAVTLVELAKRVIDASGDADVAERAGVPTRNMGCCAVLGQGAGIAAALSIKHGVELERLNVALIQAELARQGVRYQ